MPKCLKIHQLNINKITKKGCIKKLVKDIKVFLRRKKKKSNNMVVKDTKISQMKNKSLVSIENNIKREKMSHYNCKKLFLFRKVVFFSSFG